MRKLWAVCLHRWHFFGEKKFDGVRLAVGRCFPTGNYTNKYPRRIEGLRIFADMETKELIEIDDYDPVPVPETYADYDKSADEEDRSFPTPLSVSQPDGAGFELDGHSINWDEMALQHSFGPACRDCYISSTME